MKTEMNCLTIKSENYKKYLILITVISVGVGLRLLASAIGHTYDFDSYMIVVNIINKSQSVYSETTRYNYGPIWFNIMWLLYKSAGFDKSLFRIFLVLLLSTVDVITFLYLYTKHEKIVAYFFFFNPISIIITGFHNQFDNLAIILGLFAIILIGDDFENHLTKRKLLGLVVLGGSLATKHILFLYPVWLAIKQKGISNKLLMIFIPTLIFFLSFVPYIDSGLSGIIQNVFLYRSYDNNIFFRFFLPPIIQFVLPSKIFWILILIYFGFYFKGTNNLRTLYYYLCILVCTSPSIANQYLAIPLIFVSLNIGFFSILYTILGAIHLVTDIDGLKLFTLNGDASTFRIFFYLLMVFVLTVLFIKGLYEQRVNEKNNHTLIEKNYHA